jgi:hypothetical protein
MILNGGEDAPDASGILSLSLAAVARWSTIYGAFLHECHIKHIVFDNPRGTGEPLRVTCNALSRLSVRTVSPASSPDEPGLGYFLPPLRGSVFAITPLAPHSGDSRPRFAVVPLLSANILRRRVRNLHSAAKLV